MENIRKKEHLLYAVIWGAVFLIGPIMMLFHVIAGHESSVQKEEILQYWVSILPFFILFLLHNFIAAPFLTSKKYSPYIALTLAFLAAFAVYSTTTGHRPPLDADGLRHAPPGGYRPIEPEVLKIVIGVLLVLVNLGVKAMFNALISERRVQQLKEESLSERLETLRYQINPHFFMNTLNNIHALVDIDPEQAKVSIEELSKLMRLVLYEGNAPTIPLSQEMDFLRHFVSLMKLRYPESVDIQLHLPEDCGDVIVPPLVMASIVENAFKHGISYENTSFVHVSVALEGGWIVFKCANSRHEKNDEGKEHGLGRENVKKRLALLYGKDFTLNIAEMEDVFEVIMVIPEKC